MWGLGAEPPAAGGQRGFGDGVPDAEAIFTGFLQKMRNFKHTLV